MSLIPFLGPSYLGRSPKVDASRCVNLFPELHTPESKTIISLTQTPGSAVYAALSYSPIRGMCVVEGPHGVPGYLYVVAGNKLLYVYDDGD